MEMYWYLVTLKKNEKIVESGWMLAANDDELIDYAKIMGYSIDIQYLGIADMASVTPKIKELSTI